MRSVKNGWCLDADLNTMNANGTKVQLWPCNGQPQQRWYFDGANWRSAAGPNRCMDVDIAATPTYGTKIQLWDCNGWQNQRWLVPVPVNNANTVTGTVYSCVGIPASQGCPIWAVNWVMDADLNTIATAGTKVQIWQSNGQPQQRWTFTYV